MSDTSDISREERAGTSAFSTGPRHGGTPLRQFEWNPMIPSFTNEERQRAIRISQENRTKPQPSRVSQDALKLKIMASLARLRSGSM